MAVGWKNLDGNVKAALAGAYPDIGVVHYVVDSDFRTQVQGWTRPDWTGALDLYIQRAQDTTEQYVHYTPGTGQPAGTVHANDGAAIQAAIDATIGFRGDTVLLTPGSYTIATTALTLNKANMRLLGVRARNPRAAQVTLTDAIGTNVISADDVEIGFMRQIPLTATSLWSVSNGADRGYMHNLMYDAQGVAASTATEFLTAAAATADWDVDNCYFIVDALQGDCFTWATAVRWRIMNSEFHTEVASYATVITMATNSVGNILSRCRFSADADGTYTNILTGAANENQQVLAEYNVVSGTALATGTDFETGFGTTTDIEMVENYLTGDATTEGGVLIVLA